MGLKTSRNLETSCCCSFIAQIKIFSIVNRSVIYSNSDVILKIRVRLGGLTIVNITNIAASLSGVGAAAA